jgi:hypothetical protein
VRIRDPKDPITIAQFALESNMTEKKLSSKRTFHGTHRSEHPGMYDWHLLLPTGKWVRSLPGIINNPKTPEMDEDDVIFSDEEGAGTTHV